MPLELSFSMASLRYFSSADDPRSRNKNVQCPLNISIVSSDKLFTSIQGEGCVVMVKQPAAYSHMTMAVSIFLSKSTMSRVF